MKTVFENLESFRLDNGLGLHVSCDRKAEAVSFQIWVRTGSVNEGRLAGSGLSHILEHMVFKGSSKRSREKIVSDADSIGARMNAYTSYHETVFYIDCPSSRVETAADIIIDMIKNPTLPEDEFCREKDVIMRERAMRSDSPATVLAERLMRTLFLRNPKRHPIIGYKEMIESVRIDDLVDYHRLRYRPENIFIVACGNIDPDDISAIVKSRCDDWKNSTYYDDAVPLEDRQSAPRFDMFTFDDPLAGFATAFHTEPASSAISPAMDVLGFVLGGGRSSRLAKIIEREKKLAVSISASHHSMPDGGALWVSASAESAKIPLLRDAITEQLNAISGDSPPTADELSKASLHISFEFTRALRSPDSVASIIGKSVMQHHDPGYAARYIEAVKAVAPEDAAKAAASFIRPENSASVLMMPPSEGKSRSKTASEKKHDRADRNASIIPSSKFLPKVIFIPDNSLPVFDISVITRGGSLAESQAEAGISRMMADCILCGAGKRDEEEIASMLDDKAISLSVNSGANSIIYALCAPSESFDTALNLLIEILDEPTFPDEAVEREKDNEINSLRSEMLSPRKASDELLRKILYSNHPYSRGSEERIESLAAVNREKILSFYNSRCLLLNDTVIAVSGDVSDKNLEKIQAAFSSVPWREGRSFIPPPPSALSGPQKATKPLPREQAVALLGFPGCGLKDADRRLLELASFAFNGMNSSLFRKIREENGMAYYTGFSLFAGEGCGHFAFYAGVAASAVEKTMRIFHSERERMLACAIESEEFASAKEKMLFHIAEIKSDPGEAALSAASEELLGLGARSFLEIEDFYKKLSRDEVNSAVSKYLAGGPSVEVSVVPSK